MIRLAALIVLAALSIAPSYSQSWRSMLKNTPAERFTDEDWAIYLTQVRKTLSEAPDNSTATWENPKTRRRGEMTVLRSYESQGRRCRELRVKNEGDGRKSDNTFNLCSVDGKWRLVATPQQKKAQP